MKKQIRLTALAVLAALGVVLSAPVAAEAGSKGKRNTAIALGAVALYGLVKKKPVIAGLGTAGALYSYVGSRRDRSRERERDRLRQYSNYSRYNPYDREDYYQSRRYRRSRDDDDYRSYDSDGPRGWSRGRKTGWGGRSVPPGHAKRRR